MNISSPSPLFLGVELQARLADQSLVSSILTGAPYFLLCATTKQSLINNFPPSLFFLIRFTFILFLGIGYPMGKDLNASKNALEVWNCQSSSSL